MPISFKCKCGRSYKVKDQLAGKRATCKACGDKMVVPTPIKETPGDDLLVVEVLASPDSPTVTPEAQPPAPPVANAPAEGLSAEEVWLAPDQRSEPIPESPPVAPLPQASPGQPPTTDEFGQPLPEIDPFGRTIGPAGLGGPQQAHGIPVAGPGHVGGGDEIDSMVDLLGLNQPDAVEPPNTPPGVPVVGAGQPDRTAEEQAHFDEFQHGGAAASNPGKLKVSALRYVSVFPK